jgi:thiamine biosynthesis protein ThiC
MACTCREAILRLAENSGNVYIGKKKKVSVFVNIPNAAYCSDLAKGVERTCLSKTTATRTTTYCKVTALWP